MPDPRLATAVLVGMSALCPGCCQLARYVCGPDDSAWVQVSYATPTDTLRTLREAFRRDDEVAIYKCLSLRFRGEFGADALVTKVALDRLEEENPGLHMVGYAEIEPVPDSTPERPWFVMRVGDRGFRVGLVRQAFWSVDYGAETDPDDYRLGGGSVLRDPAALRELVRIRSDDLSAVVTVTTPPIDTPEMTVDALREIRVGFQWKVDAIEPLPTD
ncbi:MAG: hypothetical protein IPM29_18780 [Planctomycetes bacterium]|nr:hypothetical protein [Planctomycetota bacterium]